MQHTRRGVAVLAGRTPVRRGNRGGELLDQRRAEHATIGQMIQRRILIEPAHMHRPLDDFSFASQLQVLPVASNRDHAAIEEGRFVPIDRDLGLTRRAAPLERGEIHEGKANRAFYLVHVRSGEKDGGAMRVDARDRLSQAVSPRVLQKFENRILIIAERLRHRSTQLVACKIPALRKVNG
jgi:hypothetical protein